MTPATITRTVTLTDQELDDLLVTALEGGSNYWYQLDVHLREKGSYDSWRSDVVSGKRSEPVYDLETGEKLGEISWKNMIEAFSLMGDCRLDQYMADEDRSVVDADWADMWFQYAVMGELVFG